MAYRKIKAWITEHPGKAGAVAGWYQQACSGFTAIFVLPLIVKHLEAFDAGIWFSFQSLLAIIGLTDFGISFVLARQVAYSLHAKEGDDTPSAFRAAATGWSGISDFYHASRKLFAVLGFVGVVFLLGLFYVGLPNTKMAIAAHSPLEFAFLILCAATLLSFQVRAHQAVLEGMGFLYLTRTILGTGHLVVGLAVSIVLQNGGKVVAISFVVLVVAVLQYAMIRWSLWCLAGERLEARSFSKETTRALFKAAWPMGAISVSSFCVSSIQVPLLGIILGPQTVPGFFLAQKIVQSLNVAITQILAPQMPLFTKSIAEQDWARAFARMKRFILTGTFLAIFVNGLSLACVPPLVELWLGPGKFVSWNVLMLINLDHVILTSCVCWANFVFASGQNPFLASTIFNGVFNLILIVPFCLKFGVVGAPLASLISGLLTNYWYTPLKGLQLFKQIQLRHSS